MLRNKRYFSRGKRSIIYTAALNKKKVAIKTKRPDSEAVERMQNEANYLKLLNKYNIGPRFIEFKNNQVIYEFVEGVFIDEFTKTSTKTKIRQVLINVLKQCYQLDRLNINKEEMNHPPKHILVGKSVTMIDFERCHETKSPKNVTQFCQFLINKRYNILLKQKNIKINREKMIKKAKAYKHALRKDSEKKKFQEIIDLIKQS